MTMKKVININFQGRIIPIEETAYELLKQYVESLRKYFALEDGRDEIINDIEGRIAELFSERLKKGTTCIADNDVNAVIASIGRPEDFDAQEAELGGATPNQNQSSSSQQSQQKTNSSQQNYSYGSGTNRGRLYRNADDKLIGGVASGLANYLGIDPVIARILFVVFFAALFWVYVILWIIVPSKSVQSNITKRLYRSADSKVLGGVAGGLAAYFNIDVWIPRLIFALPLIVGVFSGPFGMFWNDWDMWWGPRILTGSLSGTLGLTYIILWIAVPIATTASEKLEMKGERVDLNSIRDTVKGDLENFKSKAQNFSSELKHSAAQFGEKAKEFGQTAGNTAKTFASEATPIARSAGSGVGHVIAVLFKAFFLFIGGILALALLGVMAGLFGAGVVIMPFKGFFLESGWQSVVAWSTLLFFFGIPVLAFLVWIIRKIAGAKKNPYIAYVFGVLWIIGLISFISLIAGIDRNFRGGARIQNDIRLSPIKDRLTVKVTESNVRYYGGWMNFGDGIRFTEDSLVLSNVGLKIEKSLDSSYHASYTRYSNGKTDGQAEDLARNTSYTVTQWDSILYLDKGFSIPRGEKFRNQHIMVTIQIPIGKRIILDKSVNRKLNRWFSLGNSRGRWRDWDWDNNDGYWINGDWNNNIEYIMTPGGIESIDRMDEQELKKGKYKLKEINNSNTDHENSENDQQNDTDTRQDNKYRYRPGNDSTKPKTIIDTVVNTSTIYNDDANKDEEKEDSREKNSSVLNTSLYVFGRMFQQ